MKNIGEIVTRRLTSSKEGYLIPKNCSNRGGEREIC